MAQQVPEQEQASASLPAQNVLVINSTSKAKSETGSQYATTHQVKASPSNHSQNLATIITGGVPTSAWDSSAAELSTLLIGKQLGSYLIEDSLGMGGMAAVFRAKDLHLERRVALKVLLPKLAANQEHVQRFEREAKLAAQLDSDHIARVHSYGQDQGLHYIAYEFIEGTNLKDLLDHSDGNLPIHTAIDLITQAAQGIHDAALLGITHRDIKPSNMIVTSQGRLKLLDLGLARHLDILEANTLTHPGSTLGTFDYLSPEQAIDPRQADVRSDIYSLGCTFYHMLTGMPPVPEGTAARKLHSHQLELPRDPRELNQEVSQELVDICSRMLAKNPDDRYQTASELLTDLAQLQSKERRSIESIRTTSQGTVSPVQVIAVILLMLVAIIIYDRWLGSDAGQGTGNSSIQASGITSSLIESSPIDADVQSNSERTVRTSTNFEVSTDAELDLILQQESGGVILLKTNVIENRGNKSWQINKKWTIKPQSSTTSILRLPANAVHPLFTIEQGTLNLENIRIELVGIAGSAIHARDESSVSLLQCELIRREPDTSRPEQVPFFHFEPVRANSTGISSLLIRKSFWYPCNCNGIAFNTSGQILIEDSSIGTHNRFITLSGMHSAKRIIQMKNTSLATARSSTFAIYDSSQATLQLDQCQVGIQETPETEMTSNSTLLQLSKTNGVSFESKNTVYYGINTYCTLNSNGDQSSFTARSLEQLESCIQQYRDEGSLIAKRSPWVETYPWQKFSETGSANAFLVHAEFQLIGQRQESSQVRETPNGNVFSNSKTKNRMSKMVTVDEKGMEPSHYMSIVHALNANADEKDLIILLKVNGNTPINPIDIGDRKVVIKGDEGFRPELSLQRSIASTDSDETSMFRVRHGELTFEFVRIRLEPSRENQKLLAVASLSGDGRCIFRNTVISLRGTANTQVSGVLIEGDSPARALTNVEQNNGSRIECFDSIVRGRGNVIYSAGTRPFTAHFLQSGIAVDGSFVFQSIKQLEPATSQDISAIQFERCTSYTTKGLIWIRDFNSFTAGLSMRCQFSNSVLANSDAHPLIRLETKQNETDLKRLFHWAGKRNYYLTGNGIVLSHHRLDRDSMATLFDSTLWSETWAQADEQAQHIKSIPLQGVIRQVAFSDWESSDFLLKLDGSLSVGLREIGFPAETMPRETMPMP